MCGWGPSRVHLDWAKDLRGHEVEVLVLEDLLQGHEDGGGLDGTVAVRDGVALQGGASKQHLGPCST